MKSKVIGKVDDSSKQFIIECLDNDKTGGFDIDSIYKVKDRWILFEYLKCDTMPPEKSDPKYYPYNWRKFYSLYSISKELNADLYLVNYSYEDEWKNQVKLMKVTDFDLEKAKSNKNKHCEYMKFKSTVLTKQKFSDWLRKINKDALVNSI